MENEIWKDVVGYDGLYEVSNLGRVRSVDRIVSHWLGGEQLRKGMLLKLSTDKDGYKIVSLYKDGKKKNYKVHRLVSELFLPNQHNLPQVNHKDEDKSNNCVDNLEFCDCKYNVNYGTARQRRSEKNSKPVLQYTIDGEFVKEYQSAKEASQQTGIHRGNISSFCRDNKKYSHIGGFVWKYKN